MGDTEEVALGKAVAFQQQLGRGWISYAVPNYSRNYDARVECALATVTLRDGGKKATISATPVWADLLPTYLFSMIVYRHSLEAQIKSMLKLAYLHVAGELMGIETLTEDDGFSDATVKKMQLKYCLSNDAVAQLMSRRVPAWVMNDILALHVPVVPEKKEDGDVDHVD